MKNLKLVLVMFVLSATSIAFGTDCGCGCGKKNEEPTRVNTQRMNKAIGGDEYMICAREL